MNQNSTPTIEIEPGEALTDQSVRIRLSGFEPRHQVALHAVTRSDDFGRRWESYALFETDAQGAVDLGRQAPLQGSYAGIDPMGLFWSMELEPEAETELYFRKRDLSPLQVHFTARVSGQAVARAQATRRLVAPDVQRAEVDEAGLRGALFTPGGPGRRAAVIVLGGGDGGWLEHGAALLASRGFVTLSLAYFGVDPLPPAPAEIPLEYFGRALEWLQAQPAVDPERVAISGTSLGGLYALLAAVRYPAIRAVIGYAPLGAVLSLVEGRSPATWQGEPLSYVPIPQPTAEEQTFYRMKWLAGEPVSYNALHLRALSGPQAEVGAIPVERINGPVLLITGQEDGAIPSPFYAERVIARLEEKGFPHAYRHLIYPSAGHSTGMPHAHGLPYVPCYGRAPAQSSEPLIDYGGTTAGNAKANIESWGQVLRFLEESL